MRIRAGRDSARPLVVQDMGGVQGREGTCHLNFLEYTSPLHFCVGSQLNLCNENITDYTKCFLGN